MSLNFIAIYKKLVGTGMDELINNIFLNLIISKTTIH